VNHVLDVRGIKTDAGRGRAWIRLALNQKLFSAFLQQLATDATVQVWYGERALLRDRSSVDMIAGYGMALATVDFVLAIDDTLDFQRKITRPVVIQDIPAVVLTPKIVALQRRGTRRQISFGDDGTAPLPQPRAPSTPKQPTHIAQPTQFGRGDEHLNPAPGSPPPGPPQQPELTPSAEPPVSPDPPDREPVSPVREPVSPDPPDREPVSPDLPIPPDPDPPDREPVRADPLEPPRYTEPPQLVLPGDPQRLSVAPQTAADPLPDVLTNEEPRQEARPRTPPATGEVSVASGTPDAAVLAGHPIKPEAALAVEPALDSSSFVATVPEPPTHQPLQRHFVLDLSLSGSLANSDAVDSSESVESFSLEDTDSEDLSATSLSPNLAHARSPNAFQSPSDPELADFYPIPDDHPVSDDGLLLRFRPPDEGYTRRKMADLEALEAVRSAENEIRYASLKDLPLLNDIRSLRIARQAEAPVKFCPVCGTQVS
jgi:hypothetical protein